MHPRVTIASAVVACLTAIATPASAQQARGTLTGAVYNPLGVPLPGVVISIESGPFGSGTFAEVVTDAAGRYTFDRLPPGVYTISSAVGESFEVSLATDQVVRRDIRMHIDEVIGTFSVCIDCDAAAPKYTPPDSLVSEFTADRNASKTTVSGAEPVVGWEYYEPDVRVTEAIRDARLTGTVVIEARVETDGVVKNVTVVSSPHPELGVAVRAALERERWTPAMVYGEPVAGPLRLTIEFVRRATPN